MNDQPDPDEICKLIGQNLAKCYYNDTHNVFCVYFNWLIFKLHMIDGYLLRLQHNKIHKSFYPNFFYVQVETVTSTLRYLFILLLILLYPVWTLAIYMEIHTFFAVARKSHTKRVRLANHEILALSGSPCPSSFLWMAICRNFYFSCHLIDGKTLIFILWSS